MQKSTFQTGGGQKADLKDAVPSSMMITTRLQMSPTGLEGAASCLQHGLIWSKTTTEDTLRAGRKLTPHN